MATDRLTQLQDCLDQLALQFYASLRYLSTHHPTSTFSPPQTQNSQNPTSQSTTQADSTQQPYGSTDNNNVNSSSAAATAPPNILDIAPEQRPDTPRTFAAAQQELAHDLILKVKQIEELVGTLPGLERNEEVQRERLKELERELEVVEEDRRGAVREREEWLGRLEGVISRVGR
ncbi:hypothetical protein Q9189_002872 [Teloschistes chrysophthalmus]